MAVGMLPIRRLGSNPKTDQCQKKEEAVSDRLLIASAMIETDCADSPIRNFATKEVHLRAIPDSPQVLPIMVRSVAFPFIRFKRSAA